MLDPRIVLRRTCALGNIIKANEPMVLTLTTRTVQNSISIGAPRSQIAHKNSSFQLYVADANACHDAPTINQNNDNILEILETGFSFTMDDTLRTSLGFMTSHFRVHISSMERIPSNGVCLGELYNVLPIRFLFFIPRDVPSKKLKSNLEEIAKRFIEKRQTRTMHNRIQLSSGATLNRKGSFSALKIWAEHHAFKVVDMYEKRYLKRTERIFRVNNQSFHSAVAFLQEVQKYTGRNFYDDMEQHADSYPDILGLDSSHWFDGKSVYM